MLKNCLLKRFDKKIQANIARTKHEIECYKVCEPVSGAMIEVSEMGFEFCGHGVCYIDGCQDFNLCDGELYINFRYGKKCVASIHEVKKPVYLPIGGCRPLFKGSVKKAVQAVQYIKKTK